MKNGYFRNIGWITILSGIIISCHQEPAIQSAIPTTCRIYQLVSINEDVRDTLTYFYDSFGQVTNTTYRRWQNSRLLTRTDQSLTYTADHYLFTQVDKSTTLSASGSPVQITRGYTYTYQNGLLQQVAINDENNTKLGYRQYTYQEDKLTTYEERSGSQTILRRYTFDPSGKLIRYEEPALIIKPQVDTTIGKIVQRTAQDGTVTSYQYDSEGQLVRQSTASTIGTSEYIYTYDTNPYWSKTQLRQRGIPTPDLGEHVQVHNPLTTTYRRYQNGVLLGEQKLTYNHVYTKEKYSLGYGRSDGMRQINNYSNCL